MNLLVLSALDCLCFWIYSVGTWPHEEGLRIASVAGVILATLHVRLFLRYVIRGFFACEDCRRLKTSRNISRVNRNRPGDCVACADFQAYLDQLLVSPHAGARRPFADSDPTKGSRHSFERPFPRAHKVA